MQLSNLIFLCAIFFLPSCYKEDGKSSIKEIYSFTEVDFNDIHSDTLVIFDVDETLIQPKDAFLINEQTPQAEAFRKKLLQKYPGTKDWDVITSIILKEAERPLIEPAVIDNIEELKKRNIPVIACTSMNTGALGTLPSMQEWRYEHLKSLGFEGSFSKIIINFDSFMHKPVFYKGILATDTEPKGPVIGAFLDAMHITPKRIIMFDDSRDYLESVQKVCKKRCINFQGFLFKGAIQKPWDERLFELQAGYLIQHRKWLSDEEAWRLISNSLSFNTR